MRWIIRGVFEALSPIAIHTGSDEDEWPEGVCPTEINHLSQIASEQTRIIPVQGIELDATGRPFLPATAIKGLLRAKASQCCDLDLDQTTRLFGDAPQEDASQSAKVPKGGMIEFRNAWASASGRVMRPAARGKTEIAEGTRTADDGQLRHDRVVAKGVCFDVDLVLTRANRSDVETVLSLLAQVNGASSESAIGSSTSQGDGRIKWIKEQVLCFDRVQAQEWLKAGAEKPWADYATEVDVAAIPLTFQSRLLLEISLEIHIEGHFLVAALGEYVNEEGKKASLHRPFRLAASDETTARLPGASLDGALRAQARRIYRTISGDALPWAPNDTELPIAFASLFGSPDYGSMLETETLLATDITPVRQEFVAIDRFTGGQTDGKKFKLEAFEKPVLKGKLVLQLLRRATQDLSGKRLTVAKHALTPEALGLLALCLKDLATGDIPLGHATRKGYGGVKKVIFDDGDWPGMLETLGKTAVSHAADLPEFEVFEGLSGREAIGKAVALLHDEATAWADRRKGAKSGEVT
ncbi:hypothetical protein H9N28_16390 [Rhodobacter capsulatus]|uniref:RAMP superfamily CRISPR-associated protein n=1 Tax=Rhodobacter capsulatus TaxID=1061 RepID=UPI0006DC48BC|nr:RAMP superfamily CRISPR-associated protein [Rhodobacter capsulatus]KQB14191.1 hypothetical protein AP073_15690 [Rhodobacter capsulatus]KQB14215.1 hypothetical protein AP071_15790 [Rhodobacter capsulatus]PZX22252.1 CRISPR/Cas system CSM-associated protein Csm3 (group 7 of RAMP superfamily) [Rhodobacter capsulatus]QNR63096.1 hypothetical protein H9N28_16390 [Rhodobacter capsulatus]